MYDKLIVTIMSAVVLSRYGLLIVAILLSMLQLLGKN